VNAFAATGADPERSDFLAFVFFFSDYVVALNQTPIFEWFMARIVVKDTKNTFCYNATLTYNLGVIPRTGGALEFVCLSSNCTCVISVEIRSTSTEYRVFIQSHYVLSKLSVLYEISISHECVPFFEWQSVTK
jgi:hypothetical protein